MTAEERRLKLSDELHSLGIDNVYYQPPSNVRMQYPCIVYKPHLPEEVKADNDTYIEHTAWDIQFIRTYNDRIITNSAIERFKSHFKRKRQTRTGFVMDHLLYDDFILYFK